MEYGPPPDCTQLELLADDAGMSPNWVREYLRREIERRAALQFTDGAGFGRHTNGDGKLLDDVAGREGDPRRNGRGDDTA